MNSDGSKVDKLSVVPYNLEEKGIKVKTTNWRDDLKILVNEYKPDLFAISSTEDMWELGMEIINELRDYKLKNNIPVIAGGVFPTCSRDLYRGRFNRHGMCGRRRECSTRSN